MPRTWVELEVPPGVNVSGVLVAAGFKYEARREGERIVAITWTQEIKSAAYAEFVCRAVPVGGRADRVKVRQPFLRWHERRLDWYRRRIAGTSVIVRFDGSAGGRPSEFAPTAPG